MEPDDSNLTWTYDEWVDHVFDHPVSVRSWFHESDSPYWDYDANPGQSTSYLTRLLSTCSLLIDEFSHDQIDEGLHYLIGPSGCFHLLKDESVPWSDRGKCLMAMGTLYRDLFPVVYEHELQHTSNTKRNAFSCYMWWDVIPISWQSGEGFAEALLTLFEEVLLTNTSEACLESVLHGCAENHFGEFAPRGEALVRRFLDLRGDISPTLRSYAERAAIGMVQ